MNAFLHNPHAPLLPGFAGIVGYLVGLEPLFATILTLISIAWYARLFYKDWKNGKRS